MQLIESYTVPSGGVSSITFDDIPDTFTDLYLVASLRGEDSVAFWQNVRITFNNNTSNYNWRLLVASGEFGVQSASNSNQNGFQGFYATYAQSTSSTFANGQIYIPNYRSSAQKSVSYDSVTEHNGTETIRAITAGLWADTSPITSVKLEPVFGTNFVQYSSATLYGITAGSDGIVAVS
jgi:hypothetical protein